MIEFGTRNCTLDHHDRIVDHIVDVARSYSPDIEPNKNWKKIRSMIELGCASVSLAQVHFLGTTPAADAD